LLARHPPGAQAAWSVHTGIWTLSANISAREVLYRV